MWTADVCANMKYRDNHIYEARWRDIARVC
jgi:hypothetical protein